MSQTKAEPEKSWWGRNWMWVASGGCLGALALLSAFIVAILTIVMGTMKSSGAYKEALAQAQGNQQIQQTIGTPIEPGLFVTGSIDISVDDGSSGRADITIPISGPKGKATIFAVATKSAGKWTFSKLVVETKSDGQRIDLLTQSNLPHLEFQLLPYLTGTSSN